MLALSRPAFRRGVDVSRLKSYRTCLGGGATRSTTAAVAAFHPDGFSARGRSRFPVARAKRVECEKTKLPREMPPRTFSLG